MLHCWALNSSEAAQGAACCLHRGWRHQHHPRTRAEPWESAHLLSAFPPGWEPQAVAAFQHAPSPVPAQLFWPASQGTEPSLHLCRPARSRGQRPAWPPAWLCLAPRTRGWQPGHARVRTPAAVCYPAASFQLATLRPHAGAPNSFLAKAEGKTSEVWVFGLGISHISLPKGFTFLSLFLRLSQAVLAVPSLFLLFLYLRMEMLSLTECLFSLPDYFAFSYLLFAFRQHLKASGRLRDCFCWFCLPGLSTSRSGPSPTFSRMVKGSYKL